MNDTQVLHDIIREDNRYTLEAYLFVLEGLYYTRRKLKKAKHITGKELLCGLKDLALERYGSMAKTVFEYWGIKKTMDFGHIVFNMVRKKVLSKTEEDSVDDFKDVYDFNKVFVEDYTFDVKGFKKKRHN